MIASDYLHVLLIKHDPLNTKLLCRPLYEVRLDDFILRACRTSARTDAQPMPRGGKGGIQRGV